jgi:hypothetical protein
MVCCPPWPGPVPGRAHPPRASSAVRSSPYCARRHLGPAARGCVPLKRDTRMIAGIVTRTAPLRLMSRLITATGRTADRVRSGRSGQRGCRWARRSRLGPPGRPLRVPASCRFAAGSPRALHLGGVAGLGALPNSVVTRAAVPGAGPGRFATSTSRPGATHPAVVPTLATQPFLGESGQTNRHGCGPVRGRVIGECGSAAAGMRLAPMSRDIPVPDVSGLGSRGTRLSAPLSAITPRGVRVAVVANGTTAG